jgi:hypothetical protein
MKKPTSRTATTTQRAKRPNVSDYERLLAASVSNRSMSSFLEAVDGLKRKFGGGAVLSPERMAFVPRDPFGRSKR